jgi:hypothetical protein
LGELFVNVPREKTLRDPGYAAAVEDVEPLARAVWTDADFEVMGWHDTAVHAIGFEEDEESARLLLDIDYISRWIEPVPPSENYSFLIAPATLVFENAWNMEADLSTVNSVERTLLVIDDLERGDPPDEKNRSLGLRPWTIHGHNFGLTVLAAGYRQHTRSVPVHVTNGQRLTAEQRGGISFAQPLELPH